MYSESCNNPRIGVLNWRKSFHLKGKESIISSIPTDKILAIECSFGMVICLKTFYVRKSYKFEIDVGSRYEKKIKFFLPGSRLTNFVGILSQGLRIAPPEAPATGYMVLFLIPFCLSSLSLLMLVLNLTCTDCFLWGPYSISFFLFPFRFQFTVWQGDLFC